MENRIEEIMKNYREELKKIDEKYEVKEVKEPKLLDTKELDEKIKYEEEFIQKLEFESQNANKDLIAKAKERLKQAMQEKEQINEKNKKAEERYEKAQAKREEKFTEMNKLKNSKVILDSGREVTQAEKDKMDKNDLKNKAIKELTEEGKNISSEIQKIKLEYDEKNEKMAELESECIEKEDGTKIFIAGDEYKKIYEESKELKKQLNDLNNMQEKCDEYLKELKSPTKEFETFVKAWNEAYKTEIQPREKQPAATQPAVTQPTATQQRKINIEVSVSEDGGLYYIVNGQIVEIMPEDLNGANYKKQLKQLAKDNKISKMKLKRVDPYLMSLADVDLEKDIISYIKGNKELKDIDVKYDFKNMEDLGIGTKNILRKIAKGAKKNGFEVKNLQKGIFGRIADKIKSSISYARLLSSAEPNKYLEEARNSGRIKEDIKEEIDYNNVEMKECLDNVRDKYKCEITDKQKQELQEKINSIKEQKEKAQNEQLTNSEDKGMEK